MMFRGVICCSGGLYAVQEGYIDVQGGYMLFRWVILMSRGVIPFELISCTLYRTSQCTAVE